MVYVSPGLMRSTVKSVPEGMEITIPVKRNWFILLFLSFWLCGWLFGEIFVPTQFLHAGTTVGLFMLAWLGMWTIFGLFAIYAWLWQLNGKEIITITSHR